MVCKLKKVIYGLKQSPQAWFDKLRCIITKVEFQKCYSHHSVFICKTSSGIVILFVYVEGVILDGIEKTKEYLKIQFVTKDMRVNIK